MNTLRRLERLEQRLKRSPAPGECGDLAREVRTIDETIARLEAEIAETEATMPPEEVHMMRLEHEADMASLDGLSLDEKLAALELEIARLEAQETEEDTKERSKKW